MTARDPAKPDDTHGRRRWRRVGQNAGAAVVGRIVSGLCQLALVPLLLSELGTARFGWAMALVALVAMSQFADLGLSLALQQSLSEAWARSDEAATRRIYASGTRALGLLGAGWLAIAAPLMGWLGPRALVAPGTADAPDICWLVIAIATCAGVPLSAGQRLASALQLGWIGTAWTAVVNVATLAAAWWLVGVHAGALGFIVLLCAAQILPGPLAQFHVKRRLGWRGTIPADPVETDRLWRAGLPLAGPAIAGALVQALAPAAVARFGGYDASAGFNVLQRLFNVIQQGHALLLAPLWPAYAEAAVRGEVAWARRTLRSSLLLTAGAAAGVALAAALLPWILSIWLGGRAPAIGSGFAWLLAGTAGAAMFAQAATYVVLGFGRLPRIATDIAIAHGTTLALMAALGWRFGSDGVVGGLAGGTALGLLPIVAREAAKALREAQPPDAAS